MLDKFLWYMFIKTKRFKTMQYEQLKSIIDVSTKNYKNYTGKYDDKQARYYYLLGQKHILEPIQKAIKDMDNTGYNNYIGGKE